ncbi:hypothetical protein D1872_313870 [compost metagenome]
MINMKHKLVTKLKRKNSGTLFTSSPSPYRTSSDAMRDWARPIPVKASARLTNRFHALASATDDPRSGTTSVEIRAPTNRPSDRK